MVLRTNSFRISSSILSSSAFLLRKNSSVAASAGRTPLIMSEAVLMPRPDSSSMLRFVSRMEDLSGLRTKMNEVFPPSCR